MLNGHEHGRQFAVDSEGWFDDYTAIGLSVGRIVEGLAKRLMTSKGKQVV